MGGKPSKGTKADMRLKENKQKTVSALKMQAKKGTIIYGDNKSKLER